MQPNNSKRQPHLSESGLHGSGQRASESAVRRKRALRQAGAVVGGAVILCGCQAARQAGAGEPQNKGRPGNAAGNEAVAPQAVTLRTGDGWTIAGDLYAAQGKSFGAVILLHQRGGQGSDWVPLCRALQKAGITALAIDQRGAGRSTQGPGPVGEDAPWLTSGDTSAAVAFLRGKGQEKSPLGLAGASYGANNALLYAAAHPDQIMAIALFSPGANYHGLDALAPARAYRGAVQIYHDKNDAIAGSGPARINAALPSAHPGDRAFGLPNGGSGHGLPSPGGEHALRLSGGSEHGTGLLTPANIKDAVAFFQRSLR